MKLTVEIDKDRPEQVIICAHAVTDTVRRLQEAVDRVLTGGAELAVKKGEQECFLACDELLFVETSEDRVWVHTARDCYACPMRLYELEQLLPRTFVRASKSCLVNTALIRSLTRSPTGVGEATFRSSEKTVFISRMYFKPVRETIEETRLSK